MCRYVAGCVSSACMEVVDGLLLKVRVMDVDGAYIQKEGMGEEIMACKNVERVVHKT